MLDDRFTFSTELKDWNARNLIIMGGTNNLYDKAGARLMGPVETSDEMFYLVQMLKFDGFNVGIIKLVGRKKKSKTI